MAGFSVLLFLLAFVAALAFNGVHLQFYSLTMLALFGWLLLALLQGYHQHHTLFVTPLTLAAVLFLGFLAFSLLYHPVPYLGVLNLWWVGVFVVIILIHIFSPNTEAIWKLCFGLLVTSVAILALWGAVEKLFYGIQPDASFYNKNSLAALISLALFPLAINYLGLSSPARRYLVASALLLFAFMLGLITSRGALLGFAIAAAVLVTLIWRHVPRRRLASLAGWLIGGFGLATFYHTQFIIAGHDVFSRMGTLAEPSQAGKGRYMLWEPAWQMLQEQPWSGIGLGAFFLKLPPLAHQQDGSAGYYVHNDYLQIATETGVPGLFFLLLVIGGVIWQFMRLARHYRQRLETNPGQGTPDDLPAYLQASGLFAALLAFGVHSAFTYNFYILPLMIVAGIYMARLDRLYAQQPQSIGWRFTWKPHFHPVSFYVISLAITFMAGGYFTTLALADRYNQRGNALATTGQLQKAHFAFENAQRLAPYMDNHFYTDADLLLHSAELLAKQDPKRHDLLDYAAKKLDKAAQLNPYQPYTPFLQGRLAELRDNNPDAAADHYRRALDANPRFIPARLALARMFQRQENPEQAFAILAAGLKLLYQSYSRELFDYMELTATLAMQTGRKRLGAQLDARLNEIRQAQAYAQQHPAQQFPSQRY